MANKKKKKKRDANAMATMFTITKSFKADYLVERSAAGRAGGVGNMLNGM